MRWSSGRERQRVDGDSSSVHSLALSQPLRAFIICAIYVICSCRVWLRTGTPSLAKKFFTCAIVNVPK